MPSHKPNEVSDFHNITSEGESTLSAAIKALLAGRQRRAAERNKRKKTKGDKMTIKEAVLDTIINIILEMRLDERNKANREIVRKMQGRGDHQGFQGSNRAMVQRKVAMGNPNLPLTTTNRMGKALHSLLKGQPQVQKNVSAKQKFEAGVGKSNRRKRGRKSGGGGEYSGSDALSGYYPRGGSDDS
jgi:hypothetical protein